MPPGPGLDAYREIWLVDFEFSAPPGERPDPVCLVAREFRSGRTLRLWQDDLRGRREPPYPIGPDCLFVAYFASAELGCHLALGMATAGAGPGSLRRISVPDQRARLRTAGTASWERWHGQAWTRWTRPRKSRCVSWPCAAVPGRRTSGRPCSIIASPTSWRWPSCSPRWSRSWISPGPWPVGAGTWGPWPGWSGPGPDRYARPSPGSGPVGSRFKIGSYETVDSRFGVFDGRTFKADRWAGWLARTGIPWPRYESGALTLDDDTFREMARSYPDVALMRELRYSLSQLRLEDLAVGSDGRNRALLFSVRGQDGPEQPSNSRFIFGPSTWLRGLIKPEPGMAVAYVDWSQQEFGIAASLSGDEAMMDAYR